MGPKLWIPLAGAAVIIILGFTTGIFLSGPSPLWAAAQSSQLEPKEPLPPVMVRFKNLNPANYLTRERISNRLSFGELLFRSPFIYSPKMGELGLTCQSCHPNGDANQSFFIPGNSSRPGTVDLSHSFFSPDGDDGLANAVRIPSLRGIRFKAPYGHDGRFQSLTRFTRHVIVNVLGGSEPDDYVLDALVAYQRELDFLPNGFLDHKNRLTSSATEAARRGEKIFYRAGPGMPAGCAGCHIASSFFGDNRLHRIGSKKDIFAWSFEGGVKTPALLGRAGVGYFHDGRFSAADQVVGWFNERYGLGLPPGEQRDLTAFINTIAYNPKEKDERHISERFVEVASLLKTLEDKEISQRYGGLVIDTVVFLLQRQAPLLSTGPSKMRVERATVALQEISKKYLPNNPAMVTSQVGKLRLQLQKDFLKIE